MDGDTDRDEIPSTVRVLVELHRQASHAHIGDVTGAPCSGKSTLVTHLGRELGCRDRKAGVIIADLTCPFTGTNLGDRILMMETSGDPMVFIRSMAYRDNLGGLAASTGDVVRAMVVAGYDLIIIKTVGTGQAKVEVMRTALTVMMVAATCMSDAI